MGSSLPNLPLPLLSPRACTANLGTCSLSLPEQRREDDVAGEALLQQLWEQPCKANSSFLLR